MRHNVRFLLLSAVTLVSANSFGADIQQVAALGCTDGGCGEACPVEGCCEVEGCTSFGMKSTRSKAGECSMVSGKLSRKDRRQLRKADYTESDTAGRCNMRTTWQAYGMNWTHRCGPIGRAARWNVPGAKTLKWCCDTKGSADSGWSPPARMPVNYGNSGFAAYHRGQWYGTPGGGYGAGAPMVYQPTDTAQLGYSYANVPTWRHDPSAIPPVPYPSNFHARICPVDPRYSGGCYTSGSQAVMMGAPVIYEGGEIDGGYCPSCQPGFSATQPRVQGAGHMARSKAMPKPESATALVSNTAAAPVSAKAASNRKTVSVQTKDASLQPASQPPLKVPQLQQTSMQSAPSMQRQNSLPPQRVAPATATSSRPAPRQAPRRTTQSRRPQKSQSNGWFGLPSLSEMKF